jgi:hypothetical protein
MQTERNQVGKALRAIREFYRVGLRSLKQRTGRGGYASGDAEAEGRRTGLNSDTLRKARSFADPDSGYTATEVAELCKDAREHFHNFTDRGATFGRTHVIRLLRAPKAGGHRARLQRSMFERGWSTAELEDAIRQQFGRRRLGGRRRRIGAGGQGGLTQLEGLCESWLRFHQEMSRRHQDNERPSLLDLPPSIRIKLTRATAAVRRVQRSAVLALKLAGAGNRKKARPPSQSRGD